MISTTDRQASYRQRIYECYATRFMNSGQTFDAVAAARWGKAYRWYLRRWLPADRAAAILDVACGGGRLLYFYRSLGYGRLAGVDVSPEQVALSRQVIPDVHQADVLDFLETHPVAFDLISGLDIIEHFHKDEVLRFLDGCYSALRPGGRVILQTCNAETPWGTFHRYNDFTHETCFGTSSIKRLLELCRFRSPETRETGPIPWGYSLPCTLRWILWQGIRCVLRAYNLVEMGDRADGVYSRIFLVSAVK